MPLSEKLGVLIVDDSAVVRQTLSEIIASDARLRVVGTAGDPYADVAVIGREVPAVMTLDIEMPRMDGLTFLQKLMAQHPLPVVICSSLSEAGCEVTLRALELGAVDIITKPNLGVRGFLEESRSLICDTVVAAAHARVKRAATRPPVVTAKLSADAMLPLLTRHAPPSRLTGEGGAWPKQDRLLS